MSSDTLNLPQNFDFLRRDRPNDSSRGGCGILINKFLKYKDLGQLESFGINTSNLSQIEAQWIHLTELDIYICSFYRSELFCPLDIFLSYFLTCMLQLSDINGTKKVMWIGDINVDQRNINDPYYKKLDIYLRLFGLIQPVKDITRRAYLGPILTESIIDVIFTNFYSDLKMLRY